MNRAERRANQRQRGHIVFVTSKRFQDGRPRETGRYRLDETKNIRRDAVRELRELPDWRDQLPPEKAHDDKEA